MNNRDPSWNQRLREDWTEYWSEVCSPAGPLRRRDPLQKWNREPVLWFRLNSDFRSEITRAGVYERRIRQRKTLPHMCRFTNLDFQWYSPVFVSRRAVLILLNLSQFLQRPPGIFAPVIWRHSALYYFKPEYYCRWPFQRRWPDAKHTLAAMNGIVLGAVDFKDIRHGQSPLTSASCWRWQTRLGFLSMPGILFTLSFLEFWKASEPPTQNHRA